MTYISHSLLRTKVQMSTSLLIDRPFLLFLHTCSTRPSRGLISGGGRGGSPKNVWSKVVHIFKKNLLTKNQAQKKQQKTTAVEVFAMAH